MKRVTVQALTTQIFDETEFRERRGIEEEVNLGLVQCVGEGSSNAIEPHLRIISRADPGRETAAVPYIRVGHMVSRLCPEVAGRGML